MVYIGIVIFLVVILDAVCSFLEAAFFTVSLAKAKVLNDKGVKGGTALLKIKENVQHTIVTLVVLSNAITIIGSMYVGFLATNYFGDEIIGIISALLTALIVVFGEILPKIFGENHAISVSLFFARPVYMLTRIFRPVTFFVEKMMRRFVKNNKVVSEDELKLLSEIGGQEGTIEKNEKELIHRVFTLNDLTAKDIMTPRTVIEALPSGSTTREVLVVLTHKPYSRYPVYEENTDRIVGIVQTSKLLTALAKDDDKELVSHYMTAPVFVSEKKRVDALLALFLSTRNHMAIVQDEFGGTVGVVTFEDVIEQLVGEIMDETDEVVDLRAHAYLQGREKGILK